MIKGGEMMKYRLKDNQVAGRFYGGYRDYCIFNNKEEIKDTLIEALKSEDDYEPETNYNKLPLWEILEMADYEIEEMKGVI